MLLGVAAVLDLIEVRVDYRIERRAGPCTVLHGTTSIIAKRVGTVTKIT